MPVSPVRAETSKSLWKNVIKSVKERLIKTKTKVIYYKSDAQKENLEAEDKNKKNKTNEEKKQNKNYPEEDINLEEIEEYVDFASLVTGVNKDFLMGMLVVESALGQNIGQCTYAEVEKSAEMSYKKGRLSLRAWQTFQERKKTIESLAQSLGYDAKKLKVSCNPPYSGTGGAMGVAQFMPDTWLEYEDRISEVVGKDNPDPWNTRDSVVAMALKVSDVPGVTEHNVWSERNASKLYLSGTTSWQYDWYANEIQYWAKNYRKLLS